MITTNTDKFMETNAYLDQYSAENEISKYTRATAGSGVNYLLDHDYKEVYLQALNFLPKQAYEGGIRILEFGCGGGMNLLRLISTLTSRGIPIAEAIGTDFSPAMVETAKREARDYLRAQDLRSPEFCVAKNETLMSDISTATGIEKSSLQNSFHFVFGVNTIRYCHDGKTEQECVRDIFNLLVPGGLCVVIDMNNRFPLFRSDLRNNLRRKKEKQCYVPSLEEYAAPFAKGGFELLRQEHFCWIPHSAGPVMTGVFRALTPILNTVARSRAMRALVVARKPL